MICKNCGAQINEGAKFCVGCGTPAQASVVEPVIQQPAPEPVETVVAPVAVEQPVVQQQYVQPQQPVYVAPPAQPEAPAEPTIPEQYRPLGAWAYFGLQILFAIPVVGFIFLIIFSFSSSNLNRRNFARSYWCGAIIVAIAALIFLVLALVSGLAISGSYRY